MTAENGQTPARQGNGGIDGQSNEITGVKHTGAAGMQGLPDFSAIPSCLLNLAIECWENRDGEGIMSLVGHEERGNLLMDNITPFRGAGIYEKALVLTYTHGPTYSPDRWQYLFSYADKNRLRECGDVIPSEPIKVYRGVTDARKRRWIRGMSWTKNPHIAAWFACRFPSTGNDPAVYSTTVEPSAIMLITNDRAEHEVVVDCRQIGKITRVKPMPFASKGEARHDR